MASGQMSLQTFSESSNEEVEEQVLFFRKLRWSVGAGGGGWGREVGMTVSGEVGRDFGTWESSPIEATHIEPESVN